MFIAVLHGLFSLRDDTGFEHLAADVRLVRDTACLVRLDVDKSLTMQPAPDAEEAGRCE